MDHPRDQYDQHQRTVRLEDLEPDPDVAPDAVVDGDPGRDWHPRRDKAGAWLDDGTLPDLDDDQVAEHVQKPESDVQYDGVRRRRRERREPGHAEASTHSPEGRV